MSEQREKGRLVITRPATKQGQTVEERLAAMEADIAEIKEMLKKALGE